MKILDVLNSPWAMLPEKLQEITDIYSRHLMGDKIDIKAIEAKAGQPFENQSQGSYDIIEGVAIIPVHGVIARRMNLFHQISGGVSTELLAQDVEHALNNDDAHSIILDMDSPGGTVDGTADVAAIIYAARDTKKIITLANGLMASGGIWIGSAANEVYIANETTISGSIGVVSTHVDYSKAYEKAGVKVTEIYAGKFKRISSQYKPLSKEGAESIQELVDYLYSVFVETVAKHRGVDVATVLDNMADGRLFVGKQAVDAGLVDGVATMDALIEMLNGGELPSESMFSEQETAKAIAILETEQEEIIMPPDNQRTITAGYISENHPEIAEHFENKGKASVDISKIAADAAQAETDRVKSVFEQSMPGHESIINEMAFDGKTTGPEAAVKVLQAEKASKDKISANLAADADDVSKVPASTGEQSAETVNKNLPIDKRCAAEWEKNAELRDEFNNDLDAYVEFVEATESGRVRELKNKRGE